MKTVSAFIAGIGFTSSVQARGANQKDLEGLFIHHVFFWLKNPDNSQERKTFEKGLEKLTSIETIKIRHLGIPADTNREVIDNTYQYSLLVGFENKEEHDIYQKHPVHLEFIEKCEHLWKRVLVYDSIEY